jgi:hypothetical protein
MGAWGYGYQANDNYYNEAASFVEPLLNELVARVETASFEDFRIRFMWTTSVLRTSEESISLSDWGLEILKTAVKIIRDESEEQSKCWSEPSEYLRVVEKELSEVENWLDGFTETGFLEDRLDAIISTIGE